MTDRAGADLFAKEPFQQVFVRGQGALRKDGVAQSLELRHDPMVDAWVVMIGTAQHHDSQSAFGLQLVKDLAGLATEAGFIPLLFAETNGDGAIVLLPAEAQDRLPGLPHLAREEFAMREVDQRMDVLDAALGNEVCFFGKGRFYCLRRHRGRRAGVVGPRIDQRRGQHIKHGEEDHVERLAPMLLKKQIMKVGNGDLRGVTGIDRTPAGAGTVHFAGRDIRVNDVFRAHAEAFQVGAEERRIGIHAQDAGNADAQLRTLPGERNPAAPGGAPGTRRWRGGDAFRMTGEPDFSGGCFGQVGVGVAGCVDLGLNAAHGL